MRLFGSSYSDHRKTTPVYEKYGPSKHTVNDFYLRSLSSPPFHDKQFLLTLFLTLTFFMITDISDSINSRMVPFSVESTFAPRRISSVINSGDCFGLQETPESCPFDDLKHHKYKLNLIKSILTLIRLFSCLICAFSLTDNQFDKHTYNA